MHRVPAAICEFVARHAVAGPGLVAVSGGADSVALLRGLQEVVAGPLTVGHFHHHLRGDASDADAAFVRSLAEDRKLAFHLGEADVAAAGGNLEATARRLRYDWLRQTACEIGSTWIATGHTANDQAETVLHRILRGTGVRGLRGIAAVRAEPIHIVRPMLAVTRADIVEYLGLLNQSHVTDATNADTRFTRSRIRHELIPLLKTFNPAVVEILGRLAEQAGELAAAEAIRAEQLLTTVEKPRAGSMVVFDAEALLRTDAVLVLRHVWHREGWPADGITAGHWKRLAALTVGDYPGRITLRRVGRVVQLGPRS